MNNEDRERDKKTIIVPAKETRKSKTRAASIDTIKSAYITEGLTEEELCERFAMTPEKASDLVTSNSLKSLRKKYQKEGLNALQNLQVNQATELLDIEAKFKTLRVAQLQEQLKNYLAHYARHGHLNKLHPHTGEVLMDSNDMPMQINIPSVIRELEQMKSSISISDGLQSLIVEIDAVIGNSASRESSPLKDVNEEPSDGEGEDTEDSHIDLSNIDALFEHRTQN